MKRADRTFKTAVWGTLLLGGLLGSVSVTSAQVMETEPNHPCDMAQNLGEVTLPYTQDGSLDSTAESPDLDFYQITGTPGAKIKVDLEGQETGKGTLEDPVLGLFDTDCNLVVSNGDNFFGSKNSKLVFTVPADGVFILAATSDPDFDFLGGGVGTYQMTIAPFAAIGSISGRIVDAETGAPIPGVPLSNGDPSAYVSIQRCVEAGCFEITEEIVDPDGRFIFDTGNSSLHPAEQVEVGDFQVIVYADEYENTQKDPFGPFAVGEDEDIDLGDIPLKPFPIQYSNIVSCDNLPSEGGRCRYSITVTNRQDTPTRHLEAWSLVNGFGIGAIDGFTLFQTKQRPRLTLKPHQSKKIWFEFYVPGTVKDGASICTRIYLGQRPWAYLDTIKYDELFCISKGDEGFSTMPAQEADQMLRRMREKKLTPEKGKKI